MLETIPRHFNFIFTNRCSCLPNNKSMYIIFSSYLAQYLDYFVRTFLNRESLKWTCGVSINNRYWKNWHFLFMNELGTGSCRQWRKSYSKKQVKKPRSSRRPRRGRQKEKKRQPKSRDRKTESLITTDKRRGDFQPLSPPLLPLKPQKSSLVSNWASRVSLKPSHSALRPTRSLSFKHFLSTLYHLHI